MSSPAISYVERATLATLRRQWALVALGGFVLLGGTGVTRPAFLVLALPVWALCLSILFRGLEENRHEGVAMGALSATLGWATAVTLLRGLLISVVAGSAAVAPVVGAAAYSGAALLDHLDGRLARRLGRATRLGAKLDMEVDALGILVATALGIHLEKLPVAYLLVGLARYLFVAGLWWRRRRGGDVRELDPSSLRRLLGGCQMGFLAVALWPLVPASWTQIASALFGGATLAMFARDWRYAARPRT